MTEKQVEGKARRQRYSAEFKRQALLRAVKDGVPAVARDLGLQPAQLYAWRGRAQQQGQDVEAQRLAQSELARLKREMTRLEEENAFLKKPHEVSWGLRSAYARAGGSPQDDPAPLCGRWSTSGSVTTV